MEWLKGILLAVYERRTLRIIADLMSDDGENPEYDRACVEIACNVLGESTDERKRVEAHLRNLKLNG